MTHRAAILLCFLLPLLATHAHGAPRVLVLRGGVGAGGGGQPGGRGAESEIGTEEGARMLRGVVHTAADLSQSSSARQAASETLLGLVRDKVWASLPPTKQDDLKRFAFQSLASAAGVDLPAAGGAAASEGGTARGDAERRKKEMEMSVLVALGVVGRVLPDWSGLMGRMQALVGDVSAAGSSQERAERLLKETVEQCMSAACNAQVEIESLTLPTDEDPSLNISGLMVGNPRGSPDFDPEEVAMSIDSLSVEPGDVGLRGVVGRDVIIVKRVRVEGVWMGLEMANVSNFLHPGRPTSNLQMLHANMALFQGNVTNDDMPGGSGVMGLISAVGEAVRHPKKATANARIVVRQLDISRVEVVLGAHFMEGRFKLKAPNITARDVGGESGFKPSRMGLAVMSALLRGIMRKVNLFQYAQQHELGPEISTAVSSLLGEVKGGVEAVRERIAMTVKAAADAVRDQVLWEQRAKGGPQQEARERFYGPEGTWDDEEEAKKKLFEDYDPNYPPQPGDEDFNGDVGGGAKRVLADFEQGLRISQEGAKAAFRPDGAK